MNFSPYICGDIYLDDMYFPQVALVGVKLNYINYTEIEERIFQADSERTHSILSHRSLRPS